MRAIVMILGLMTGAGLLWPAMPGWAQTAEAQVVPGQTPGKTEDETGKQTDEARLWQAMRLAELMPILRDEALVQADEMAAMLFERGSDAGWRDRVAAIHDPARLTGMFSAAFAPALAAAPDEAVAEVIAFYETPAGRQLVALELDARRAMLDADTEEGAIAAFADAVAIDSPRVAQIDALIEGADLIEPNVAAALNASLAFSRGFADEGGYQVPMSEGEILSETWAQEEDIRQQTHEWIEAFLYLAYSPLSDAELDAYIAFASSDAGLHLSEALLAGFDALFAKTSYEMGQAAAQRVSGQQL